MDGTKDKFASSIADIAAECGVSAMTVSRALRNNTSVKSSTRKRIMDAAEKLGYCHAIKAGRPPVAADRMTPVIDLVLGTPGRGAILFYSELLVSIERTLAESGFDCVIRTCDGEYGHFIELRDRLRLSSAQGSIIAGAFRPEEIKALMDVSRRSVLVDNPGDASLKAPFNGVSFVNVEAGRMAVRHLVETGRRRIALIKGFKEHYFSKEIETGYKEALAESGIAPDESLILESDFTAESACERLSAAIEGGLKFDAVFTNDEMACGVYRALTAHGLKIPSDVAVCGCDGLQIGRSLTPSLTTMRLDYVEMGRLAVESLLSEHFERRPRRLRLLPELCVNDSTSTDKFTGDGKRYGEDGR